MRGPSRSFGMTGCESHGIGETQSQKSNINNQTSNMNIGFVGVGRMGANMARRLVDRSASGGYVTAVYDSNRKVATELAAELGCAAAQDLSEVTAESDMILTVVT